MIHAIAGVVALLLVPEQDYQVYVASEAADKVSVVRFGPDGASVAKQIDVGIMPTDIDGPHGLTVSPDGRFYYVSFAHGQPFGAVWKYSTADNAPVGKVTLGMFPATMQTSPDGDFLYVVNFNLHGDMAPSSVSIVSTDEMIEIARIQTCTMPHGSRVNPAGTRQYSVCMMDDMLVEVDTRTLRASRHIVVTKGRETGMNGAPHPGTPDSSRHQPAGSHGTEEPATGDVTCSPTWAQPSSDGDSVFVACNGSSEIIEVDVASWKVVRRIPAGPGVYNLAITKNGRLIATNRRGQSVSIFEIRTGRELARIPTRRRIVHGAAVSPDDKFAFITVEGIADEPGTLEIIDLATLKTIATVDLPPQAGGVDLRQGR